MSLQILDGLTNVLARGAVLELTRERFVARQLVSQLFFFFFVGHRTSPEMELTDSGKTGNHFVHRNLVKSLVLAGRSAASSRLA